MDVSEVTINEKCENLMNVVVETRKRFSKKCVEYDQKTSIIENKKFNLQLELLSKAKFNPKCNNLNSDVIVMRREIDSFVTDIQEREKRIENLCRNVKNTEQIVLQLKEDELGRRINQPLTAEVQFKVLK